LALVVVGRRAFISHSVQPVVARNYLYCGIYSFDCLAEARFKVAHYPSVTLIDNDIFTVLEFPTTAIIGWNRFELAIT
jgi:hypothetical protein